jgi:anti-sigma regulatory factor (Ser/Thr protein kinase)
VTRRLVATGARSWAGARGTWELPAGPGSALVARGLLRSWLFPLGIDPEDGKGADIVLAVSEAVANAAVHGLPPVRLMVTVTGAAGPEVAECSISDSGEGLPLLPVQAGPDRERGRGLEIIAALADRWGFFRFPKGGQLAWLEFRGGAPAESWGSDPAGQPRHEVAGEVLAS